MSSKQLQLKFPTPAIGTLDSYVHYVNQIPLLTAEEEYSYAKLFQDQQDLDAARHLILAHLRYVVRVAKGYLGYGLPLGDLIQEGNVGLMKAVKRFNPEMGVRLVSFAVHWIKAEIHKFIIHNWRIVKMATTKAQLKLFFNLRQMKKRLGWFNRQEIDAVAKDLGVSSQDVLVMEQRLNAMDVSYDFCATDEESETSSKAPAHYLCDENSDPAILISNEISADRNQEQLFLALEKLDARSQDILRQRWLVENKLTLHDLASKYSISAERVRQLEKNAMTRLKKYIANS